MTDAVLETTRSEGLATARPACFVLSAGRTGTVFLARLLQERFPEVVAVHEPYPARYESLLGILGNETGIGGGAARALFLGTRRRRLAGMDPARIYVELNPLLCPIVDALPVLGRPLNVIHLVRAPAAWARSIVAFKASRKLRPVIDHIPFARPYPVPRPAGWARAGATVRALWRWRVCNERIRAIADRCERYAVIRYEDLFAADAGRQMWTLNEFLAGIPVRGDGRISADVFSPRINPAPEAADAAPVDGRAVRAICGELMDLFGYEA